jgi:hypothetical protein
VDNYLLSECVGFLVNRVYKTTSPSYSGLSASTTVWPTPLVRPIMTTGMPWLVMLEKDCNNTLGVCLLNVVLEADLAALHTTNAISFEFIYSKIKLLTAPSRIPTVVLSAERTKQNTRGFAQSHWC